MYKRKVSLIMISVFLALFLSSTSSCWGPDRMEKAEEAIRAEMPKKAIKLLKEEINENPGNAEAHYKLGLVYLKQANGKAKQQIGFMNVSGPFDDAIKRFRSAASLDEKYREKAVNRLFDLSVRSIKGDDVQNAYDIIKDGLGPLGVSRHRIVKKFREHGVYHFNKERYMLGHRFFRIVYTENKGGRDELAQFYADYAKESGDPRVKIYLLKKATKISDRDKFKTLFGRAMIERAENFSDTKKKEKWIKKAADYLPAENGFVRAGKDYLVVRLKRDEEMSRTFRLNKGEKTPWILIPKDYHFKWRVSNSKDIISYQGNGEKITIPADGNVKLDVTFRMRYEAIKDGTDIVWTFKRKNY